MHANWLSGILLQFGTPFPVINRYNSTVQDEWAEEGWALESQILDF